MAERVCQCVLSENGQTFTGVSRRGGPDWKANVGMRGEWDSGLNGEIAVHYVASATYPLIELFSALAPVLPTPTSSTVDSYTLVESARRVSILARQSRGGRPVFNAPQRSPQGTSSRRYTRQPSHGLVHDQTLSDH